MKTTLVQPSSNEGRIKFIEMTIDNDTVTRKWGLVGGKTQDTSHTYDFINKGKKNELDPIAAAKADYERRIKKKIKEGYRLVDSLDEASSSTLDEMDFDNIPTSFVISKPHKNTKGANDKDLQELIDVGETYANFQIKENGICHFIVKNTSGEIKIYTRRWDDHTTKYPAIIKYAETLEIGPKTMLACEFTGRGFEKHMDAFQWISKVSKSNTTKGICKPDQSKALACQEEHAIKVCVFHIPYLNGKDMSQENYGEVYHEIENHISPNLDSIIYYRGKMQFDSLEEMYKYVKDREGEIEGLVGWDERLNIEIGFNGKPKRRAAYKIKIIFEDDVIAYAWNSGKGDHQNQVGSIDIGKHDLNGKMIEMGSVGSGIKDDEMDPKLWTFPCVVEIEYQNRFPTGKYQFPVFIKKHEDKILADITVEDDIIFGKE